MSLIAGIIPIFDKMARKVSNNFTFYNHRYIMPWQSPTISGNILLLILSHIDKVIHSAVIVFNAWIFSDRIIIDSML